MIILCVSNPSWTEIIQALGAVIAIPLTLITVYKLVKKDKERESEIKSLSTIANQLTEMQIETEKRYKSSKKPFFEIKLEANFDSRRVKIDFENTNTNTAIIDCTIVNDFSDFTDFTLSKSSITSNNGKQNFWIILTGKSKLLEFTVLHLNYTTEEGYIFIQDITIWLDNGQYVYSPSAIIIEQNSKMK